MWLMSALPPKADMCAATRDVRFVPKADIAHTQTERPPHDGLSEFVRPFGGAKRMSVMRSAAAKKRRRPAI